MYMHTFFAAPVLLLTCVNTPTPILLPETEHGCEGAGLRNLLSSGQLLSSTSAPEAPTCLRYKSFDSAQLSPLRTFHWHRHFKPAWGRVNDIDTPSPHLSSTVPCIATPASRTTPTIFALFPGSQDHCAVIYIPSPDYTANCNNPQTDIYRC